MKQLKFTFCLLFLLGYLFSYSQEEFKSIGYASFYAGKFHGRKTASGERFNQKAYTCAHRTLPFGTNLRVTNLKNNKSLILTVNDRGPFRKSRIIDITKTAASELDFVRLGEAKVEIEIVSSEGSMDTSFMTDDSIRPFYKMESINKSPSGYSVKIASYLSEDKMFEVIRDLKTRTDREAFVQTLDNKKRTMYRVFAGLFTKREEAEQLRNTITSSYPECYVVELKSAARKEEDAAIPKSSTRQNPH